MAFYLHFVFAIKIAIFVQRLDQCLGFQQTKLYGYPCNELRDECSSINNLFCSPKTRRCDCDRFSTLHYTKDSFPYCRMSVADIGIRIFGKCPYDCKEKQFCNSKGYCECSRGYISVPDGDGIKCIKEISINPKGSCYISEVARICDVRDFTICNNSVCECYEGFKYNNKSKRCIVDKSELDDSHRISKKGETCASSADCDDYLNCIHSICVCPKECSYSEKEDKCKCRSFLGYEIIYYPFFFGILVIAAAMCMRTCKIIRDKEFFNSANEGNSTSPRNETIVVVDDIHFESSEEEEVSEPSDPEPTITVTAESIRRLANEMDDEPPSYLEAVRDKLDALPKRIRRACN